MQRAVNEIILFGADWCPDCRRAKAFLDENDVDFVYRDTELDESAVETVEELTGGQRVIPTIQILGRTYVNPDNVALALALGINPQARVVLYGADWCPDCRRAKAYLGDNGIKYQYIDVDEHDWATAEIEAINDGKRTIPTILVGDTWYVNPDNATLRDALGIEQESSTKRYDTLILGAGATGLTAAIYLQRAKRDTVLLEGKNVGGNAFLTAKIENYPGFVDISGPDLMDRMAEQARSYGAEVETGTEVTAIATHEGYFRVSTDLADYEGRSIVIATGSQYRRLEIPGEDALIGSGVHFCATCDAPFYKGRSIIVVGGGNSALEEGLYLTEFASEVTFVVRSPGFTAEPIYTEKLESIENASALMNRTAVEFVTDDNGGFRALRVQNNETGEVEDIMADGAFVFIGLTPNTAFLEGTVNLDEAGYVDVAPGSVETSVPGIFAAGDCRKGAIAQVAAATGEGVIASFAVNEFLRR
ncbi:MAG: FAD-dependent oxidoreductase [Acidimicrobiia bacterium]|nr:FAD-dependent oxidoreductase [Acidimicrobiia bacterium]